MSILLDLAWPKTEAEYFGFAEKWASRQVKTDCVDSENLAQYYANSLLTIVAEPNRETEQDRDLVGAWSFILLHLDQA